MSRRAPSKIYDEGECKFCLTYRERWPANYACSSMEPGGRDLHTIMRVRPNDPFVADAVQGYHCVLGRTAEQIVADMVPETPESEATDE